jgi:IPTL-CTERM motif
VPATNCENDPTPVAVGGLNAIGIAKQATNLVDNGDGTFTTTIVLTVENLGSLNFTTVQVTDDLAATFPAPANVVSVTVPATSILSGVGTLTPNGAFTGTGDTNLLVSGSSTLSLGAVGEIVFDVTFDPAGLTAFFNSALASGGNTSGTVTDTSDSGADPDPDGDGDAEEPGENDPTPISIGRPINDIPTVSGAGLLLLAFLLGALGFLTLRRRG